MKITIIFGSDAVSKLDAGERNPDVLKQFGDVITREFSSDDEVRAYRLGLNDACGYMECVELETGNRKG
jgi:hypothetical protein